MSEMVEHECPVWMVALIRRLGWRVSIVQNNTDSRGNAIDYDLVDYDPTYNTGARWSNDTFSFQAFYWGTPGDDNYDEDRANAPNFRCGDIEVCWYKNLGRGTTINRPVTPDEGIAMFDRCWASLEEAYRKSQELE